MIMNPLLAVVVAGDNDLPGLTDIEKPRMRGPKRATKIRKLFNLTKEDDVRKYVNTYRRSFVSATGTVMAPDVGVVFCHASFRAVADVERGPLLRGALY